MAHGIHILLKNGLLLVQGPKETQNNLPEL